MDAVKRGFGVELWYVYTGTKSANVEKHVTVYNQNPDNIARRRTFRHYHAELGLAKFREDGRLRQLRIDVAGQYAAAFRGDPVLAYKHKAFIFSKNHDEVFPPDVRVEEVLFQCVCGDVCKEVVSAAVAKGSPEDTEVRILNKGGVLFVLATLARVALLRNGSTYLKSITEERVSSNMARHRLRKYAEYARNSYVQAVCDLSEASKEELSTLVRQREFWDKAIERIARSFQKDSIAKNWVNEALPKLF